MATLSRAASAGALLLDQKHPGWAHEIELDRLNMSYEETCVLGQLYGVYWRGLEMVFERSAAEDSYLSRAIAHGFQIPDWKGCLLSLVDYAPWNRAWRREIQARLTA